MDVELANPSSRSCHSRSWRQAVRSMKSVSGMITRLFRDRDERQRADRAELAGGSSAPRLEAGDAAPCKVEDRWYATDSSPAASASRKSRSRRRRCDTGVQQGVEERVARLAVDLGLVPRRVGVAQHLGRRALSRPLKVMPMLALTVRSVPAILNGWRSASSSRSRAAPRSVRVEVVGQDRELVAAEARDDVARRTGARCDARRHQELVARGVAEPGVDLLEAVEVEEHQVKCRSGCAGRGRAHRPCPPGRTPVGSRVRLSWKAMCCSLASARRRAVTSCICRISGRRGALDLRDDSAVHRAQTSSPSPWRRRSSTENDSTSAR